ncbi:hypothetical protein [Leifsonia sp. fls2-241-R2A-40a]|uniref:DUF7882 family protein n=1 Tax=Leifsonia sp. fls2-241-R2A-40a TaxID=3040290 RepID=UPI00255101FD|nr:hypothetical protein [Leifsonia sp. fls2-241-R2A-40a]
MAVLSYGGADYDFSDRTLAHLQVVITSKLRRRESFALSWIREDDGGRETIWVDNGFPIRFRYDEGAIAPLNREWLEVLMDGTHRPNGLLLTPEPGQSTLDPRDASTARSA